MKLIITDGGEPSVGIFSQTWYVDCPFEREDTTAHDLEFFSSRILEAYKEFSETHISVEYDFELQDRNNRMDKYICDGCNVREKVEHKCHFPNDEDNECGCKLCHPKIKF